jgi:hypothetical protein
LDGVSLDGGRRTPQLMRISLGGGLHKSPIPGGHVPRSPLALTLVLAVCVVPCRAQSTVDWNAKETALWQAIKDRQFDSFAAGLDSTFVGVYAGGTIGLDAQIAAVQQDTLASFQISEFTVRTVDSQTILLTYRVSVTATNTTQAATYWASSLWRLRAGGWRTVLHTAVAAT